MLRKPLDLASAWKFLGSVMAGPGLSLLIETERHSRVAEQLFEEFPFLSGNLLFDAHTVVLMKEHGIRRIYTRDADFHRFPDIEVLDPLAA